MAAMAEREASLIESVDAWTSYYRENPHKFAADFLGLTLKPFQKMLLYLMNKNNYFCYMAARGQGKSFLLAIYCCVRCILWPGTKIIIVSGTKGQAINVLEKVKTELMPNSGLLENEIMNVMLSMQNAYIMFKNGSFMKVVTASDTARSNRANILLVDEFRMVDRETLDAVLRKFLTSERMPGYMNNPKYKHLSERNKEIYLSSAYFKSHWCYDKFRDYSAKMLEGKGFFSCGLPYQLSVAEGLLNREQVLDEMSEAGFNDIRWSMEMECRFFGSEGGTFFEFDLLGKSRKIAYSMLPDDMAAMIDNSSKVKIKPKEHGEKRVMSVDVALLSSRKHKNDATSIFINQLVPTKAKRYMNNIVYTENIEGGHTSDQALRIRTLFDMYDCDYLVIDGKGAGIGVCDALIRPISDPDTGEIYPALSSCNNEDWAARCGDKDAKKALWIINATAEFNSECAMQLRAGFMAGRIKLLADEYAGEKAMSQIKGWKKLETEAKVKLQLPYINTTLLIKELIGLQHKEINGRIKLVERRYARKDRYSSLSYNYYVATQLETKIRGRQQSKPDELFQFRAPTTRRRPLNYNPGRGGIHSGGVGSGKRKNW